MSVSRRELLKSLSASAVAVSAGRIVPDATGQSAHHMVRKERAASASGNYIPKFFSPHQYKILTALCQTILPPDQECAGAVEAGAPEFLDLITSENKDLQLQLGGGMMWLDSTCIERYGQTYLACSTGQQKEILDLIAFRKNIEKDSRLGPGVNFFAVLRKGTADGFFTSKIGIKYLGYTGNTYLQEFPGCPEVPEA
jgi:hypothetical protein